MMGAARRVDSPPVAQDVEFTFAPDESGLIQFVGFDPDGDLFGFIVTSGLSDPTAGTLISTCVCFGIDGGPPCNCITFFRASATFAGSVTFTYRAVDSTNRQSADATVTIHSTVQTKTPEQILNEMEFIIRRGTLPSGTIRPQIGESLLIKVIAARRSFEAGNATAGLNQVGAFCNELEAQAYKGVLEPAIDKLRGLCLELPRRVDCDCKGHAQIFSRHPAGQSELGGSACAGADGSR
jgi:hypothetical protein